MAMIALLLAAAATQSAGSCPNPVAPDVTAARKVAQATIDAEPTKGGDFELIVEPDRDLPSQWIAYQAPLGRAFGGGGWSMRIDRCSGIVSALHRQR